MKFNNDTFAIIVLYKIELKNSKSFLSLTASLKQNDGRLDLLVYDNSPEYNENEGITTYPNWNIIYKADASNGGVSSAYNFGAKIAAERSKKWLLLLDQDTIFPENTVDIYTEAITNYPGYKIFAPIMVISENVVISPCKFKFMRGTSLSYINPGPNTFRNLSVINSGMCIDVNSFKQNGGYNENIRLDFSDHDFIKRFKSVVSEKFIVLDLKVPHDLSTTNKNSFNSDFIRFGYYLEGSRNISSSITEKYLLKINAIMRAFKLLLRHRSFSFLVKVFK